MKKERRRITKAAQKWCDDNGHEFVSYVPGIRSHDNVRVTMFGHFDILLKIACTSGGGAESGVLKTITRLNKEQRKCIQAVSEGRPYVDRRGPQALPK